MSTLTRDVPTEPARPRRVLLVCHFYPPHVGGIETVVQAEAERLAALGHEVTVLTSAERSGTRVEGGVRVVRVRAWNGLEHRAGVPFPLFSPRILVQAIRLARQADIVHVHDCFYLSSWSAGIASVLARKPLVLSQHVAMVEHPSAAVSAIQKLVYGTAGRLLVRRARRVFVINDYVGRFVAGLALCPKRSSSCPTAWTRTATGLPPTPRSANCCARNTACRSTGRSRCSSAGSCRIESALEPGLVVVGLVGLIGGQQRAFPEDSR